MFSTTHGFGEKHHVICPLCWKAEIFVVLWEDGTEDISECVACKERAVAGSSTNA